MPMYTSCSYIQQFWHIQERVHYCIIMFIVTLESLTVGTMGKPIKSSHSRKTSRTPQPTTAKQTSGGRNRKK